MKKGLFIIASFVLTICMVLPFNVSAMTEEQLISKISESYNINGKTVNVKAEVITQVKRYLSEYDLTSEECDIVASKIDEAISIAKNSKASSWNELSSSEKAQMVALAEAITNSTSIKATLTSDGKLTIFNADGSIFAKISDAIGTDGASTSYTGVVGISVVVILLIAIAGFVVVTRNVTKAND